MCSSDLLEMNHPSEIAMGIYLPVQVYPMFETAIRAKAGRSVEDHAKRVSELWSRFSEVASRNPNAWIQKALTPEEIRTPGPTNRMIGFPYPKYMNSNNDVDQGAAIIMCSVEKARSLGIAHALVSDLDKLGGPLESLMAVKGPAILEIDMRKVGPFAAAYAGPPDGKASKGAA